MVERVFLSWVLEQDAIDSLDAVNVMYGCPYEAENGYRADRWAEIKSPNIEKVYGFFKPESRLGKEADDFMDVLKPGVTVKPYMPEDFDPREEDVDPKDRSG